MSVSTLLISITPSVPFCSVSVIFYYSVLRKEITLTELQYALHVVLNSVSMILYPEQEITLKELQLALGITCSAENLSVRYPEQEITLTKLQ